MAVDRRGKRGIEWRFRKMNGQWQRQHPDGGPWQSLTIVRHTADAPATMRGTSPTEPPRNEWIWT